ncbi:CBS domain-containing protein [bacterium]|jgi:CBS domain-containing protein|nr:CBS domain-containing protein [bacterium]
MSIVDKDHVSVNNVMLNLNEFPIIQKRAILKDSLEQMSLFKLGIACVVEENETFVGLITDGDIRRILLSIQKPLSALFMEDVLDHIAESPTVITPEMSLSDATKIMGLKRIWDLPVVSENKKLVGLFHLHRALEFLFSSKDKKI